jgi:YD repeat-containing protein
VTAFRNRAGESVAFTVDSLGRLTAKNLPGSEPDVTYT